jgi:peptidoglycan L-alanyl-D-glutamate endopeptidase CwlK
MTFKLSKRSKDRLEGVDERLVQVVERAIELTDVDFGVICGLRTEEEQKELVASGASKTMKSKHIDGHAVDLMAYTKDGRACWELSVYDNIAEAMRTAAIELEVPVRWGGAWTVLDIREWRQSMAKANMSYVDTRRHEGKRPFIDAPHFELMI